MRHPTANQSQRTRRKHNRRIDYFPSADAERVIEAVRAPLRPNSETSTNGAIIDAIVTAWADHAGIKYSEVSMLPSSGQAPEFVDHCARTSDFETVPGISTRIAPTCARANDSVRALPIANQKRVTCGARRRRDGEPCQSKSVPGKRRCKWHGGCSTGPKTPQGKTRALANLRRGHTTELDGSVKHS
jgi:hypothetical protein